MKHDNLKCPKQTKCERKAGHSDACGGALRLLHDVAKKQGGRLVDWLANKAIDALGGASK